MVGNGRVCAIRSCKSNTGKIHKWQKSTCVIHQINHEDCACLVPYGFHVFPKDSRSKSAWITTLEKGSDYIPSKYERVCSLHFIDGKPTAEYPHPIEHLNSRENMENQNKLRKPVSPQKSKVFKERQRYQEENNLKSSMKRTTHSILESNSNETEEVALRIMTDSEIDRGVLNQLETPISSKASKKTKLLTDSGYDSSIDESFKTDDALLVDGSLIMKDTPLVLNPESMTDTPLILNTQSMKSEVAIQRGNGLLTTRDASTQWEDPIELRDHVYCKKNISPTLNSVCSKSQQVNFPYLSFRDMKNSDCVFYTGIQLEVFAALLEYLIEYVSHFRFQMEIGNQFLLVLIRLRLGLLVEDLGRRFQVSASLISKIFVAWLPVMAERMKYLVFWIPREQIQATLPKCFQECYPNTTCIIDCFEIYINRPSLLRARALTYSSYKNHNTVKFLVGIAPSGQIMFLSKCYGGRASDKFIFTDSKIINYTLPGDELMADRGFKVNDELLIRQVKLNVPAFTKGKTQLSEEEVDKTRRIAYVRIHVERAIRRLKEYKILRNEMCLTNLSKSVDNIVLVCGALCNLKSMLIKETDKFECI